MDQNMCKIRAVSKQGCVVFIKTKNRQGDAKAELVDKSQILGDKSHQPSENRGSQPQVSAGFHCGSMGICAQGVNPDVIDTEMSGEGYWILESHWNIIPDDALRPAGDCSLCCRQSFRRLSAVTKRNVVGLLTAGLVQMRQSIRVGNFDYALWKLWFLISGTASV